MQERVVRLFVVGELKSPCEAIVDTEPALALSPGFVALSKLTKRFKFLAPNVVYIKMRQFHSLIFKSA